MVVASSTWVRPAQALIYSDSGEVKYFPPKNRGRLPRALTFGDHQEWINHASDPGRTEDEEPHILSPFEEHTSYLITSEPEDSYLITSGSENFHIEDPPEEYASFESEYTRHSMENYSFSCISQEVPSMSTPTEQYVKNVLKRKGVSHQSMLPAKLQHRFSSISDTQNACMSPLLLPDSSACMSLDELVDLYSKKLEAARVARLSKVDPSETGSTGSTRVNDSSNKDINIDESKGSENDRICVRDSNGSEHNLNDESHSRSVPKVCKLVTLDLHLFFQKLDEFCQGQQRNIQLKDWKYISTEEFESIVHNSGKEIVEFLMVE